MESEAHLSSLAVQVIQDDVLGSGQHRLCVERGRDVQERELEVWWHRGRLLRVVFGRGVGVVVAAVTRDREARSGVQEREGGRHDVSCFGDVTQILHVPT